MSPVATASRRRRAAAFSVALGARTLGSRLPAALRPLALDEAYQVLAREGDEATTRVAVCCEAHRESRSLVPHLPFPQRFTETRSQFEEQSLVTTVSTTSSVRRPLGEVASLLDPRSWAARSEFWEASYVVERQGGRVVRDHCGYPVPDPAANVPPARWGSDWRGVLLERTRWDLNERTLSRFDVLIHVELSHGTFETLADGTLLYSGTWTNGPQPLHRFFARETPPRGELVLQRFSLYECVRGQLGYAVLPGGVNVDSGDAWAMDEGHGWTRVEAQKRLRYPDWTPERGDDGPVDPGQLFNFLAPAIAGVWLGNLVGDGLQTRDRGH